MWQVLPFDDLQHYQQLGYHISWKWLIWALIIGLAIGAMFGLDSDHIGGGAFPIALVGVVFFTFAAFLQMEESRTTQTIIDYNQLLVDQALVNACLITSVVSALLTSTVIEVTRWLLHDIE